MTISLISPSETALAEKLGERAIISPLTEEKGADILIYTTQGLIGIQRKEVPHDFISSFTDGRMAREASLLKTHCRFRILLEEGRFRYYPDTRLVVDRKEPSRFTRRQIHGMENDIRFVMGIDIVRTEDIDETAEYIKHLPEFIEKKKHLGLYARPSAQGTWYVPTARDIELWLLQSFPGIGPTLADNIVTHFGKIPMGWTCTLTELEQVPGLGKKRAKAIFDILSSSAQKQGNIFDVMRARLKHE